MHHPYRERRRSLIQLACDTVGGELEPDHRPQRAPPHRGPLATLWRPGRVWSSRRLRRHHRPQPSTIPPSTREPRALQERPRHA
ncbi:hypothetical protein AURDEDRAFT_176828 [Auricularia subglabra TFB-10046 SS5]|uniref:Uncharacterized protein n=1 Tax=Auricularia subglabra (strain TFB-10046 / SS5) TaxID=717982 RepID=J0WNZ5_AURST|nr:hypothetical protein AURDEDRAFT_176828 [Auricularia subglabra TFB-10046 SS5]